MKNKPSKINKLDLHIAQASREEKRLQKLIAKKNSELAAKVIDDIKNNKTWNRKK